MKLRSLCHPTAFSDAVLLTALLAVGGFHEIVSCLLAAALLVRLIVLTYRKKPFTLYLNLTTVAVAVIVLGYGLSCLWAFDKGIAPLGFIKFLPLLLFLLERMQAETDSQHWRTVVPMAAAGITIVSSVGSLLPALSAHFTVAGRLAGFFQYPNTFALFLLVSALLILAGGRTRWYDLMNLAVLVFGILYTGSRTVFVLTVVAVTAMLLLVGNKRTRLLIGGGALGVIAVVAVAALLLGERFEAFTRFLTISLSESTFVGRFLYFQDALPVIAKHPFGLGFWGYYFTQQSFQTGLYAVRYIHNDFLQLLLDIGWLPCLLFIAAMGQNVFSKRVALTDKVILFTVCAHALFDFDLQFIGVFLLLLLLTDFRSGKRLDLRSSKPLTVSVAGLLTALCLFFGIEQTLYLSGANEAAHTLYPYDTINETVRLQTAEPAEADRIADRILSHNDHLVLAHSAKARYAYSRGDLAQAMQHKRRIFQLAPYAYAEYEEYAYMLIYSISLYQQAGDLESAAACYRELTDLPAQLRTAEHKMSDLGRKIDDQPNFTLPQDVLYYIERMESQQ